MYAGAAAVARICFNKSFAAKLNEMLAGLSHSLSLSQPSCYKDLHFGPSLFPRQAQDMNMFRLRLLQSYVCANGGTGPGPARTSKDVVDIYARGIR